METKKAIKYFEDEVRFGERSPAGNIVQQTEDWTMTLEANRAALAALREKQERENPKPLTEDELRQMDGDKIYIQYIGTCKGFYDDEYAPYYGQCEQYVQKYNGMLRACDLPLKYYGETWIAYRHKPEEVQP